MICLCALCVIHNDSEVIEPNGTEPHKIMNNNCVIKTLK
jgi:hypothetical protein